MILIDSNILMYAAGAAHRCKQPSISLLEQVGAGAIKAMIDAEVLQEVLHRYRAINRWEQGRRVYDLARQMFPQVISITGPVLDEARRLLDAHRDLRARDALHAAVCIQSGAEAICSYDTDFDAVRDLRRVEPEQLLQ